MKQQTAIEWLLKRYTKNPHDCLIKTGLFEIAKEMEKLQIMQSYNDGKIEYIDSNVERTSEDYYNETFGE